MKTLLFKLLVVPANNRNASVTALKEFLPFILRNHGDIC